MNAHDILKAAAGHMSDRAATYDKPQGERSMSATVEAFKAVSGISLTEEQGWLFMALLKAVRSQQGAYRADSYEDGAAYFALAGEAAYGNRGEPSIARMAEDFGQQHVFEPASEIDDESDRIQAIGQNGNSGEHYDAEKLERWKGAPVDATHWAGKAQGCVACWYKKLDNGRWVCIYDDGIDGKWGGASMWPELEASLESRPCAS